MSARDDQLCSLGVVCRSSIIRTFTQSFIPRAAAIGRWAVAGSGAFDSCALWRSKSGSAWNPTITSGSDGGDHTGSKHGGAGRHRGAGRAGATGDDGGGRHSAGRGRRRRRWRRGRRRGRKLGTERLAVSVVRVKSILSARSDNGSSQMVPAACYVTISFSSAIFT